jgi:hypothetical protein
MQTGDYAGSVIPQRQRYFNIIETFNLTIAHINHPNVMVVHNSY